MRLREKIDAHPAVESIHHEGRDGWWVSLNDGFEWQGCTQIHEYTLRDVWRELTTEVTKEGQ